MWVNGLWTDTLNNDYLIAANPSGSIFGIQFYPGKFSLRFSGTQSQEIDFSSPTDGSWHSVVIGIDSTNLRQAMYIDRVLTGSAVNGPDPFSNIPWDTYDVFWMFASDQDTPSTIGDFSDTFVYTNRQVVQSDGTIAASVLDNFITADNKPVNPATAIAAYGQPALLFSGDASAFAINKGTGGAFTLTGALTNATTSPSDG
jgi:hypothetical protein